MNQEHEVAAGTAHVECGGLPPLYFAGACSGDAPTAQIAANGDPHEGIPSEAIPTYSYAQKTDARSQCHRPLAKSTRERKQLRAVGFKLNRRGASNSLLYSRARRRAQRPFHRRSQSNPLDDRPLQKSRRGTRRLFAKRQPE
jgi:hypothetical protein